LADIANKLKLTIAKNQTENTQLPIGLLPSKKYRFITRNLVIKI